MKLTIEEQKKQIEELKNHLLAYIQVFDNENISDDDMKEWLDDEWIPKTRILLDK